MQPEPRDAEEDDDVRGVDADRPRRQRAEIEVDRAHPHAIERREPRRHPKERERHRAEHRGEDRRSVSRTLGRRGRDERLLAGAEAEADTGDPGGMDGRQVVVSAGADVLFAAGRACEDRLHDPVRALALVTINPAKQLQIDSRVGSLEVGKDGGLANAFVYIQTGLEGKKFEPVKEPVQ